MSLFPDKGLSSPSDEQTLWEKFIASVRPLKSKRRTPPIKPLSSVKKRIRVVAPEPLFGTLDLHGLTFDAAFLKLSDFLYAHHAAGSKSATIITGKSRGIETLSTLFPKWMGNPSFDFISRIEPKHGGGSYVVFFKKKKVKK